MKILRIVFATLVIGVASISTAQAHDSFSLGLNFGSPYYYQPYQPPAVTYYPNPPVYYYGAPPVYYQSAPPVYYYPQASFGWNHGWGGRRWHEHEEHEEHEHHRWHDRD